ncbi:MAG: hypothetical protein JNK47_22420 [Mesorhizobium sp.]|nr:hypothetical protein [Mesorhizobium sp.]MBL8579969.1 hypothetical protein [Mesorhizobium sp.]
MSENQAHDERELAALALRLRQLPDAIPRRDRSQGRGIVIPAGGSNIFTNAYVLISILRRTLGCKLPIEVWHLGPQEMSPTMARLLYDLDVMVVDALPRIAAAGLNLRDGWQLKSFCLQHCRFAEVLLLDADQVPLVDPSQLFDWQQYGDTGAVFWPDVVGLRSGNPVWQAMGLLPETPEISLESGQVLVDKRRHWKALSIAVELNQAAALIYRYVYGDKDTFLLAFRLADEVFSLVPHGPFRAARWMAQRDFSGAPIFQHLTNCKWSYSSDESPGEGFRRYDECLAALRHLRQRWNGRIFHAPDRPPAARSMETELAAAGRLLLEVIGEEKVEIELLPHGEIGIGRSAYRQNWWCDTEEGQLRLLIRDADRVTYRLRVGKDGVWEGLRSSHVESSATLTRTAPLASDCFDRPGMADDMLRAINFPEHGDDDWVRLRATVEIVARFDPSLLSRLHTIASMCAEPSRSTLLELVDGIEQQTTFTTIERTSLEILHKRYRPLVNFDK